MKHNATPTASTAIRINHGKARWVTEVTGTPLGGVEGIGKGRAERAAARRNLPTAARRHRLQASQSALSLATATRCHTVSHDTSHHSSPVNAALWLAAGTAAGVFVGVLLANRFRGGKTLINRLSGLLKVAGIEPPDDAVDELDEEFDEYGAELHDDEDADDAPGIDERVLAAFEQDPILSERAIEIDADAPGTVVLRGTVPSAGDVAHALIIARGTPGVTEVENLLRVRAGHSRSPADRGPRR
jgi:hypothetical protein